MPAVLFGSISTVADTSELQRKAFNEAFAEHGLDWEWDREDYLAMLETAGGQQRIADYAKARGEQVDAAAVHTTKSKKFQQDLINTPPVPRAGVVDTIKGAKAQGLKVGLVTTTTPGNIAALLGALSPAVSVSDFDVIVDVTKVDEAKPQPAAYSYALAQLGEQRAVAIEDNLDGVASAKSAGVAVVAFPNSNTAGHDFSPADQRVDALELDQLTALIPSA